MAEHIQNLKITLIGDVSVGKTALITRLFYETFDPVTQATVGASFYTGNYSASNGKKYRLQVWDTAGQERFRSLIPMYTRGTNVILFVYDLSNKTSFHNLTNYWVNYIKESCWNEDPICFLIGTKSDLVTQSQLNHIINKVDLTTLHDGYFDDFYVVSALKGIGTEGLILSILDNVVKSEKYKAIEETDSIVSLTKYNDDDKWCCFGYL